MTISHTTEMKKERRNTNEYLQEKSETRRKLWKEKFLDMKNKPVRQKEIVWLSRDP